MWWSEFFFFFSFFFRNKSITWLDISNNNFGNEGRLLIERGKESRKTMMSALQLVASGMTENKDSLEIVL